MKLLDWELICLWNKTCACHTLSLLSRQAGKTYQQGGAGYVSSKHLHTHTLHWGKSNVFIFDEWNFHEVKKCARLTHFFQIFRAHWEHSEQPRKWKVECWVDNRSRILYLRKNMISWFGNSFSSFIDSSANMKKTPKNETKKIVKQEQTPVPECDI